MDQSLANLNIILKAISDDPSLDYSSYLFQWIAYICDKNAHGPNAILIVKGRPKLKSMFLTLSFQEQVNNKLRENYLEDLEKDIIHIRKNKNILGGSSSFLHIKVTVKRKNPLIFCFGERCMSQARIIQPNEPLIRFRCCIFHTFCKNCAKDYLERKLGQSAYDKRIPCLACEAIGDIVEKYITDDEIKNIIPAKDYNNFILKEAADTLLFNCGSKLPSCPFKDTRITESKVLKFNCGELICKECYAMILENYIYDVYNKFMINPKELCNEIIKFGCPSRHPMTLGWIKLDQAKELLKLSKSDKAKKNNIMNILEKNSILFSETLIKFCNQCKEIVPIECCDQIDCVKCNYCLTCFQPSHSSGTNAISCEDLKSLLDNPYPKVGRLYQKSAIDQNHPLFHTFTRAIQCLGQLSSKTLKIDNVTVVDEAGIEKFYNENLKLQYPNTKNAYFISEPYGIGQARSKIYEPLPVDDTNGMIIFPCNVQTKDACEFLFFKILSADALVNRVPSGLDKKEVPQIFMGNNLYYVSNRHAITLLMILQCSKVS
ncbi:hypothetical protein SteCoe_27941 [Stentor coeruleus]|uniref:Uncharacterized protein n=1 Tax=Stentor coeruleus TaxID=5963 RepID=A0A1R2B9E5_9CILI|nr:hypothetical protein SteCoe_27941 [Stentor coeruleus]